MARARRHPRALRLLVAGTLRDLAYNWLEVNRVLATERIDPDAARMILWAMDLTSSILPAEPDTCLRLANNSNVSDYVPGSPLFAGSCIENHLQVPENTREQGEGVPPPRKFPFPTCSITRGAMLRTL